jgi:hypothetical protein
MAELQLTEDGRYAGGDVPFGYAPGVTVSSKSPKSSMPA